MNKSILKKLFILFLIPLILYICLLPVLPQMEPDEPRYSLIAAAMNESDNYVTPRIKNVIYLEKPPLVSWVTAFFFKLFGENDFSARLFTGLCAWGCILLAYIIGRHFRDYKTGLYAAAILTVSCFHFFIGRLNILDMPLNFFICLAIWIGYLALKKQTSRYLFYLFYLICALTFLIKGLIGVVFPFAILIIWLIWVGQGRKIMLLFSPVGILIFLLAACPWIILAQQQNPDFLWYFFVREHFLRFTTEMHGKTNPFYYYLPIIIGGTLPWSVYLFPAWSNTKFKENFFNHDENKLLLVWFFFILLFYSVSSSKLMPYIAPVFIPLALFAACILKNYEDSAGTKKSSVGESLFRILVTLQSLLLILTLLIIPLLKVLFPADEKLVIMTSGCWWLYIVLPVIALVMMTFLPNLVFHRFGKGWFYTIYLLSALFLGSTLLPLHDFLAPYRSSKAAKEAIVRYVPSGQDLYQYRVNFYGIDFYNKIRTPIVEDFGELSEGIVKLAPEEKKRYFLSANEFFELCTHKKDIYCITQRQRRLKEIKIKMPHAHILWDNGAFYLLHIHNRKEGN